MKWASNKAIYAERRSARQMYYACSSAKRYAKRYGNSLKTQMTAQRVHLARQRADSAKLGREFVVSTTTWASVAGRRRVCQQHPS